MGTHDEQIASNHGRIGDVEVCAVPYGLFHPVGQVPERADTLVRNLDGEPYTRDGFDTMWDKLKRKLAKEGKIRPGLTFHGLRKSLGRDAAALGFSENDIAGALGQKNPASARPYTVEHQQRDAAKRVIEALEQKGKR
jgi:hypothetical protein